MATTEDIVRLSGGVDTEYLDLLRFQAFLYYYHYVVMNNYKGDFGVIYECQQTPRRELQRLGCQPSAALKCL